MLILFFKFWIMAHSAIREYDAKQMFFSFLWQSYSGKKIQSLEDFEMCDPDKTYVIKPDQLFWKRWKLGLVGVKYTLEQAKKWYLDKYNKNIQIQKKKWVLDTFLIEEYIPHKEEYYLAIKQEREYDEIFFSNVWWIDVEENWDKVQSIKIWILEDVCLETIWNTFWVSDESILWVILQLFLFYRQNDFVYLEVNPFCFDERTWYLVLLDMVAKLDDTAFYLHTDTWKDVEFPNTFGFVENIREKYIKELDQKTWASLKLKFLNTNGKIWTLLSWWWGSLVMTDTLWYLGYTSEIANYGELSWDPDRFNTREYTRILFEQMLESAHPKYLIIWWAIANFTQIDKTFTWIIDVLEEKASEIKKKWIKILVRRWGINDTLWLQLLSDACFRLWIYCKVANGDIYMTDILQEIQL